MRRDKINIEQADKLINKFYEGLTEKAEEQQIARFLAENPTLEGYEAERALFSYYAQAKPKKIVRLHLYKKWLKVAAVVAIVVTGTLLYSNQQSADSYAYVDGKRITGKEKIKSLAMASFETIKTETLQPEEELAIFKEDNELIDSQLDIFLNKNL